MVNHLAGTVDDVLHRQPDALAKVRREFRLPLAGILNGPYEWSRLAFFWRSQRLGSQQVQERPNLIAGFAFFKPQRDIPLAPSFVVRAGVDQPPLDAVGKQCQFLLALAEPFDNARNYSGGLCRRQSA